MDKLAVARRGLVRHTLGTAGHYRAGGDLNRLGRRERAALPRHAGPASFRPTNRHGPGPRTA
jgi:hypothetical protein